MAQWYVKDLSRITKVSVQTLHHYDRIGLLKPSLRLPNGYRVYSEKDLLRLQQILAMKFFGFELSRIKTLLGANSEIVDQFSRQSQFLEEKAKLFLDASEALKSILSDCRRDESIPWKTIIKIIEVYHMTQELEKSWAGKTLNQEELKQYANFEAELKTRFTEEQAKVSQEQWRNLTSEILANLDKDPSSDLGIALGKRCMDWVNRLYGKKYVKLRKAMWEKGFKGGHVDYGLSSEGVAWLDKAISAYYKNRVYQILDQVGIPSEDRVLKLWNELLVDMCGDEQALKDKLVEVALKDQRIKEAAKTWLKAHR